MSPTLQTIIVLAILAACIGWQGWKAWRTMAGKRSGCGCAECPAVTKKVASQPCPPPASPSHLNN